MSDRRPPFPGDVVVSRRRISLWAARIGQHGGGRRACGVAEHDVLLVVAVHDRDMAVVDAWGRLGWTARQRFTFTEKEPLDEALGLSSDIPAGS